MNRLTVTFLFVCVMLSHVFGQFNWTKYAGNPVLTRGDAGSWDAVAVGSPTIIYDGTLYHLWYNGNDGSGTYMGYASSTDKINWEKHPDPILDKGANGSWDDLYILHPTVYFDGATYHMWYTGRANGGVSQIGYATSPDSINWTKYSENPVLTPGTPGSWDDQNVNNPEVLFIDSVYHMWYGGFDGSVEQTGHATSVDGITWEKDELNPVIKVGGTMQALLPPLCYLMEQSSTCGMLVVRNSTGKLVMPPQQTVGPGISIIIILL